MYFEDTAFSYFFFLLLILARRSASTSATSSRSTLGAIFGARRC